MRTSPRTPQQRDNEIKQFVDANPSAYLQQVRTACRCHGEVIHRLADMGIIKRPRIISKSGAGRLSVIANRKRRG